MWIRSTCDTYEIHKIMADGRPLRDAREDFALEIYKNHGLFFTAINNVFTLL